MKKSTLLLLTVLLSAAILSARGQSVPPLINYQGQLLDAVGNPMPTGDYDVEIRLFPVESGGALVWGPQTFNGQSGIGLGPKVSVVQGHFNLVLGPKDTADRNLLDIVAANPSLFLEIKIGTGSPIAPRQQLLTAPYALGAATAANAADALYSKVSWRIIPLLIVCYMVAYLDRINIGYAQLQMKQTLPFDDAVYGLGAGMFFIGYFLFEVPSNLLLERIGARKTLLRIMVLWGLAADGAQGVQHVREIAAISRKRTRFRDKRSLHYCKPASLARMMACARSATCNLLKILET